MVDRQIGRTLRRSRSSNGRDSSAESGSGSESTTESNTVADASADDNHVDGEFISVKRDGDSSNIGIVEIDPEQLGNYVNRDTGGSDNGTGTRKRRADAGKPRGTRKRKAVDQNYESVVTMVHTWAAVLLKTPEIELEQSEAKRLADAYNEFCQYHDVPILTPKRMSEINLVAIALSLYGPRYVAWRSRKREEKMHKHGVVMPINSQAQAAHAPVM